MKKDNKRCFYDKINNLFYYIIHIAIVSLKALDYLLYYSKQFKKVKNRTIIV